MAITLDLSSEDLAFLTEHLGRYVRALDDELVHSDSHQIQHDLARDVDRLRRIHGQLAAARA